MQNQDQDVPVLPEGQTIWPAKGGARKPEKPLLGY